MPNLSAEQKKQLNKERQAAVRNAWKAEKQNVLNGKASRDWTPAERSELLSKGSISGYEGHHMKSVSEYPKFAGDSNNIQFLTHEEHLNGAHKGSYHNPTNGYFDYKSGKMHNFNGNQLKPTPKQSISSSNHSKNTKAANSKSFKESLKSTQNTQTGKSSVSKSFSKSVSSSAGQSKQSSISNHSSISPQSNSSEASYGKGSSSGGYSNGGHGNKH